MSQTQRINNPYVTGTITEFKDGSKALYRTSVDYKPSQDDRSHITTDFDDLHSISNLYYGDSKYYWVIMEVNGILNPWNLEVGKSLRIPELQRVKALLS